MIANYTTKDTIAIFFALVAIIIYFIIALIVPKRKDKTQNIGALNGRLIQLNIMIDRYNNLVQLFELNLKRIKQEIMLKEDVESLEEVIYIENEFNLKCKEAISLLEKAKISLSNKKEQKYENLIEDSENAIEDMQIEMNALSDIKIKDKRQNKQTKNQKGCDLKTLNNDELSFFLGCDTISEIEKRYKALAKAFHPDTGHGDEKAFQELQRAYERKKQSL